MELPSHHDITAAVHILHKISTLANRNSDKVVLVVSSILEALAHLQMSSSPDAIEQAQRAVALARSRQLDTELQNIPQINSMIQIVDIACSLLEYDMVQSIQKLQVLQKLMDQNINNSHWNDDGSFQVPMSTNTISPSLVDQTNILRIDENGRGALVMSWLPQHDLYALCYFLSSVTLTAKNSQDGHKAEKFLREGLRMIKSRSFCSMWYSTNQKQIATRAHREVQILSLSHLQDLNGGVIYTATCFFSSYFLPALDLIGQ